MVKQSLKDFVVTARKKGVPLLSVATMDQSATLKCVIDAINEANKIGEFYPGPPPRPLDFGYYAWSRGLGMATYSPAPGGWSVSWSEMDLGPFLHDGISGLSDRSMLLVRNGHWLLDDRDAVDIIQQVRDLYEASNRTLVLLGPSFTFPPEIRRDFISFDEPLPDREERVGIAREMCESNDVRMSAAEYERVAGLLGGLSRFTARQATAMSLKKTGIDHDILWERKRSFIQQTRGVSFSEDPYTFADVGGNRNVIEYLEGLVKSLNIGKVVHLDELDKDSEGMHDSSGVGAHQHQELLTLLDPNRGVKSVMLNGMPGTGKTMIARALGPTFGIPTITFKLGGTKGEGLVGQAEKAIAEAIEVISSAVDGTMLVLATTNRIGKLSPELRDRFSPTFFFDYPDGDEKLVIWTANMKRFKLGSQPLPNDAGWSGRNIMHCCMHAAEAGKTLVDAAKFIVAGATANAVEILEYRKIAMNAFVSAAHSGVYDGPNTGATGTRKVVLT